MEGPSITTTSSALGTSRRLLQLFQKMKISKYLVIVGMALLAENFAYAQLIVAPAAPGEPLSATFSVTAQQSGGSVTTLPVYVARVCSLSASQRINYSGNNIANTALASFASFDMGSPVNVVVTCTTAVSSVSVLPASYNITPTVSGNTVSFTVNHPGQITVEINGDWVKSLHLFANPIETNIPNPNDPNVIYYGPGVYHNVTISATSGQTVYIADGAILYGATGNSNGSWYRAITLNGSNISLRGHGIIDGSLCQSNGNTFGILNSINVSVEGIIVRDSDQFNLPVYNSSNVQYSNVKCLGWRGNSDGIDVINSQSVDINNSFFRTYDDLIVVKAQTGGPVSQNITAENCVLWNECAHALSLGTEMEVNVSNVKFSNCDIIHDKGVDPDLMVDQIECGTISNITWDNIRLAECNQLMAVLVGNYSWSQQQYPGQCNNVVFSNITSTVPLWTGGGWANLQGYSASNNVNGVQFRNVVVGGSNMAVTNVYQNNYVYNCAVSGGFEVENIPWQQETTSAPAIIVSSPYASDQAWQELYSTTLGQGITYSYSVPAAGTYQVVVGGVTDPSFGQCQFSVNGVNCGAVMDEYAPWTSGNPCAIYNLGTVTFPTSGPATFAFTCAGKNSASSGYNMGIDYVQLIPIGALTIPVADIPWQEETNSASTNTVSNPSAVGGAWQQLYSTAAGQYITYPFPVPSAGTYTVVVGEVTDPSFGQFQLSINGVNQGPVTDEYAPWTSGSPFATYQLGTVTFGTSGNATFAFTCAGKNSSSTNYTLGFDYIELIPQASGGGGGTSASIGIQFQGPGTALAATDSAGVSTVAQTNWNVLTGSSFTSHVLSDSTGVSTTATISGSANGTYWGGGSSASPVGNAKLANGELYNGWPGQPTLTVSNIPYANYDVYVYAGIDASGRAETVGLTPSGGATQYYSFSTEGGGSAWTAATSSWNGTGTQPSLSTANYVHYSNLTAGSFTLAWGAPGNGGLNGIQIVPKPSPKAIGVQFQGPGTALLPTDSAGLSTVAQTNWNVLTGASFSSVALSDSTGASTTATLSGSAGGTYWGGSSSASPAGNSKLASGELFDTWPGAPTLTVSNIPYAKYDVYLYAGIDATGRAETIGLTPSGGTQQFYSFTTETGGSAWTVATSTWNGTGTQPSLPSANYVHFTGLTSTSFTLAWGAPGNGGLNGIQIVPTQ